MGEMRERMPRGELCIADDPGDAAELARAQELLAQRPQLPDIRQGRQDWQGVENHLARVA